MKNLIQYKNWALFAFGGILCAIIAIGSLGSIFDLYQKNNQQNFQLHTIFKADSILKKQQEQLEMLNKMVEEIQESKIEIDNHLEMAAYIDKVSSTNDLQTILIPHVNLNNEDDSFENQFEFSFQGSYRNILLALYQIEYQDRLGMIQRLSFEKQKVRTEREKREVLSCKVLMEKFDFPIRK